MSAPNDPVTERAHTVTAEDDDTGVRSQALFRKGDDGVVRCVELTFWARDDRSAVRATALRDYPMSWAQRSAEAALSEPLEPMPVITGLGRPDGSDRWYKRFAAIYSHVAQDRELSKGRPAVYLAQALAPTLGDVPANTIYRWAWQARKRGYLPPTAKTQREDNEPGEKTA